MVNNYTVVCNNKLCSCLKKIFRFSLGFEGLINSSPKEYRLGKAQMKSQPPEYSQMQLF